MTDEGPMMTGAATVLVVTDMAKSMAYYRDVLGFEVTFEYGQPVNYVCLCRDDVALHLIVSVRTKRLPGNTAVCVFVRDIDRVYAEFCARGARLTGEPQTYDYGMREFEVLDLDGNQLIVGMGVSS